MPPTITLVSAPESVMPAYNPIKWVFNSSDTSSCDFTYIMDLYVNDVFAIRLKAFPNEDGYGVFNIERVIQDYLSFNFRYDLTGFQSNPNSIVQYYFEIRARYNDSDNCTGDSTLTGMLYTSENSPATGYFAWNGALQYKDYPTFSPDLFVAGLNYTNFLSNSPRLTKVGRNDYLPLSFLQYYSLASTQVSDCEIKTYDAAWNLLATHLIPSSYGSPGGPEDLHITIGIGPKNLIEYGEEQSPDVTIIHDNVKYYKVTLMDGASNYISATKVYEIDDNCYKFRKLRLFWLNRLGGFDGYSFNLKSTRRVNSSRSTYSKYLGSDYSIGDRGDSVTGVDAKISYSLNSDWMEEEEAIWLEELFTSPEVYMYDNTPVQTKVIVTGAVHISGTAAFIFDEGVILEIGTTFSYSVTGASPLGMSNTGTGTITGYSSGQHLTDVVSTINSGALVTGSLIAETEKNELIPVLVNTNSYEEKLKSNIKNINYTLDVVPSYKVNVQGL